MSLAWHGTHQDQGRRVASWAMTLPRETWNSFELTGFGLCWDKDTGQAEALGGWQEASEKDEAPEGQHLPTQHLQRDPRQPKHQSHHEEPAAWAPPSFTSSGLWGRFPPDIEHPGSTTQPRGTSSDPQHPFPTQTGQTASASQGAAEAE